MMIYKNDGKKGFAVSTNIVNRENLGAAGLTATVLALVLIITNGNRNIKSGRKETNSQKPRKKNKKSKTKGLIRLLFIPAIMKTAKFAVTQGKLQSLVRKIKAGENIGFNIVNDDIAKDEPQKDDKPVSVCGMEIIEPINIGGEEEVYEHL